MHVLILAVIQGLTEFLPISSSAHLILASVWLGWPDQGLTFDVALHLGSLIAIVGYFRHDLGQMATAWLRSLRRRRVADDTDARLAWMVLLGMIPVGLCGLLFHEVISTAMRSPLLLAASMIGFGLLLGWADWRRRGERSVAAITWRDVVWISLAQAVALIPGTSRSGITMTAGLMVGLSREAAARFSFLLAVPVIVLANILQLREALQTPVAIDWIALSVGTLAAVISTWLCIHLFLRFIQRVGMLPFVIYRVLLGAALIWAFA